MKTGRKNPCPCGSGKKYKKYCFSKDLEDARKETRLIDDEAGHKFSPISNSDIDEQNNDIPTNESEKELEKKSLFNNFWDEFKDENFDIKISKIKTAF